MSTELFVFVYAKRIIYYSNAMNFLNNNSYRLIQQLENQHLKNNIPKIDVGDIIQVSLLIREGNKERLQLSQGVVISVKNTSINTTITIRKNIQGIGVEKVYLVHSPKVVNLKTIKKSKVRKAKLFYLREKSGKASRLKQKFA